MTKTGVHVRCFLLGWSLLCPVAAFAAGMAAPGFLDVQEVAGENVADGAPTVLGQEALQGVPALDDKVLKATAEDWHNLLLELSAAQQPTSSFESQKQTSPHGERFSPPRGPAKQSSLWNNYGTAAEEVASGATEALTMLELLKNQQSQSSKNPWSTGQQNVQPAALARGPYPSAGQPPIARLPRSALGFTLTRPLADGLDIPSPTAVVAAVMEGPRVALPTSVLLQQSPGGATPPLPLPQLFQKASTFARGINGIDDEDKSAFPVALLGDSSKTLVAFLSKSPSSAGEGRVMLPKRRAVTGRVPQGVPLRTPTHLQGTHWPHIFTETIPMNSPTIVAATSYGRFDLTETALSAKQAHKPSKSLNIDIFGPSTQARFHPCEMLLAGVDPRCFVLQWAGSLGATWNSNFDRQQAVALSSKFCTPGKVNAASCAKVVCAGSPELLPAMSYGGAISAAADIQGVVNNAALACIS